MAVYNFSKNGPDYKYVRPQNADPKLIVGCSCKDCNEPAVYIDHFFPYHAEYNRCATHLPEFMGEPAKTKTAPRRGFKCAGYPCIFDQPPQKRKAK